MGIHNREKNSAAFSGMLWCPICTANSKEYDPRKQAWKLDRWITNTLARYICKKCGTPVRYEISNRSNPSASELTKYGLIGR
jgi:transposase-like protein